MKTTRGRLVVIAMLVMGMAGLTSTQPSYAAVTACPADESALQSDITSAGNLGTVVFDCAAPTTIHFTSTITIGQSVTLDGSNSEPVTIHGGKTIPLFSVSPVTASLPHFTLHHLTLTNGSGNKGGAIYNNSSTVTITNSRLDNNSGSTEGGAIYNSNGTVTIIDSVLDANHAGANGGAIYNSGTLTLTDTTLSHNTVGSGGAGSGAALWNFGTATITGSTFAHNSSTGSNGAIWNYGTLHVGNSTFTDNTATFDAGAISSSSGTVTIGNSTFHNNSAGRAGGALWNNAGSSMMTVRGTIVADSLSGGDCSGTITDGGYNLETGTACGFTGTGDLESTNADLKALANNGGPTETMALDAKSRAIDAIPASSGLCPAKDQRGVTRLDDQETACDIGAYEHVEHLRIDITVGGGAYSVYFDGATLEPGSIVDWRAKTPLGDQAGTVTVPGSGTVHALVVSHPCPSGHITVDATGREVTATGVIDVTARYEGDPC